MIPIIIESMRTKVVRRTRTLRLRRDMTAGDVLAALKTVPQAAQVVSVEESGDAEQAVVFELEEPIP